MLKLFRVEHANAEELMKDIEIPHVGDRDVIDREFYDKYRKSEFVILVYAESIEQIKQQYERWDSGGFDPDVYYEAFENGIIKEVETITDLDDVNYCDCNGNYFVDEYLPDERNYFDTICEMVNSMSLAEKVTFYQPIQILVAINSRYYETTGERNLVKFKLAKIFNKEI